MIFSTPSVARRRLLWFSLAAVCALLLAFVGDIFLWLFTKPQFPTSITLQTALQKKNGQMNEVEPLDQPTDKLGSSPQQKTAPLRSAVDHRAEFRTNPLLRTAFLVSDDLNSIRDFKKHAQDLDVIFPTGLHVSEADGKLDQEIPDDIVHTLREAGPLFLPVISNTDRQGNWRSNQLAFMLDDPVASEALIQQLLETVTKMSADGINIDFEQLGKSDADNLSDWVKRLTQAFHEKNLLVTIDIPLNDDAYDPEFLGEVTDAVVVMAYDQHFATDKPGSIAGQAWFTEGIEEMSQRIPEGKMIIALGAYGYDWNTSVHDEANAVSFDDAMFLASDTSAKILAEEEDLNSHFSYSDSQNQQHEVWFLDALSAWNQLNIAHDHHLRGYSLWRLGLEDPGLWGFLPRALDLYNPKELNNIPTSGAIHFMGDGELLQVLTLPCDGRRESSFSGRLVDWSAYRVIPRNYEVNRYGHMAGKAIALTFDDGPDPEWTPAILEILNKEHISAAFFVVGDQAQKNPGIIQTEYASGHLLGNHTFFHPNIQTLSKSHLEIEINSTERVIESITGHGSKLFRAPYDTDSLPSTAAELEPLHTVENMGLIVAGGDIDSEDYACPGADAIQANILKHLKPNGPNVIVMHDGGGNRSQTVEALAKLIPKLRHDGYEFVSLSNLIQVKNEDLMPKTSEKEDLIDSGESAVGFLRTKGWSALQFLFYFTTAISILRIIFLGIFVRRKRKTPEDDQSAFTPAITVLIPAFNEAKVICRTIDGLLNSGYPDLEILIVDDGSNDDTVILAQGYEQAHPNVRVLKKINGGKWSALNLGFRTILHDYVVMIDADTIVPPGTIHALIAPFRDPQIDAVCGNVQVGNVKNLITAFQDVEYVTTQNYDRRAFDSLNCISVVPGATGAWKRQAVLDAGGFSNETLTEDADLTLTMLQRGARIVYAPDAKSVTEAPERAAELFRQRFRWSFGTFQCLWKHRHSTGKGTLGCVAIPNLFLFQIVYPILSPLGDIVFLMSLIRGDFSAIATGYGLFLLMDLVGSLVAYRLDHKSIKTLWVVLIQRFYYRQFMYLVTFKAVIQVLRGGRQFWNKLERKGSVKLPT